MASIGYLWGLNVYMEYKSPHSIGNVNRKEYQCAGYACCVSVCVFSVSCYNLQKKEYMKHVAFLMNHLK